MVMNDLHFQFAMIDQDDQFNYDNNIQFGHICENTDMFPFKALNFVVIKPKYSIKNFVNA